jgi:hypothetical protein
MDKDLIILIVASLILLYLYYSAIVGIIKKKFSPIMLLIFFGHHGIGPGNSEMKLRLENEEAVGAAVLQLWIAILITVAILGTLLDETFGLIPYSTLQIIIPLIVIITTIIAVIYIVKVTNKYKKLENT